jgi:hypothetical protein
MEKIEIWYSIQNGWRRSAYPVWFLTEEEAYEHQESMDPGWGEDCIGSVETFVGSDIHLKAISNGR